MFLRFALPLPLSRWLLFADRRNLWHNFIASLKHRETAAVSVSKMCLSSLLCPSESLYISYFSKSIRHKEQSFVNRRLFKMQRPGRSE